MKRLLFFPLAVASTVWLCGCGGGQANTKPPKPPPVTKNASGARAIAYRYIQNGSKRLDAGDVELAVQSFERAVATLERAERELPDEGFTDDLGRALNRLGRAQFCASRVSEAIATYDRSRQLQEAAIDDWSDADTEANLLWTEYYLADALRHAGEFDRSDAVGREAAARARTIAGRSASAGVDGSTTLHLEEKLEETALARSASAQWPPPDSLADVDRFLFCYYRVLYFATRGEFAAAEEALEHWRSLAPPGQERYNLACGHAIIANSLVASGAISSDEGRAKFDAHTAAALTALREAIDAGYNHFEHMRSDLDLIALRSFPEFRTLVKAR